MQHQSRISHSNNISCAVQNTLKAKQRKSDRDKSLKKRTLKRRQQSFDLPNVRISFAAQVDLVDFSGPDYKGVDKRCVALRLVEKGLCDAALFSPSGESVLWSVGSL